MQICNVNWPITGPEQTLAIDGQPLFDIAFSSKAFDVIRMGSDDDHEPFGLVLRGINGSRLIIPFQTLEEAQTFAIRVRRNDG